MARLRSNVFAEGAWYGPGDEVPADVARTITNPKAWEGGEVPSADDATAERGSGEPPRSGAGSGKDAWTAYAASVGVEHDPEASRDDIVAAVDAARSEG